MRSDTRPPYHNLNEAKTPVRPAVEAHPYDPNLVGEDADALSQVITLELEVQTQEVLKALERSRLLPETKAAILASTTLAEYLENFDAHSTTAEYEAAIRQTAREMAMEKRQQLEHIGLRFNNENTLILDKNGQEAMENHPKLRAELQRLSQLTEAQYTQFSPTEFKDAPAQETEQEKYAGDTNLEREWLGEPRRQETEQEQKQLLILDKLHTWPIPPELKMSILNHPAMVYNLKHTELPELQTKGAELIRNVAQEMASDERVELQEADVHVDEEGALVLEDGQAPILSAEAAKHLQRFQDLLEVVHFKQLKKRETPNTPAEQLSKLLLPQLKRLGLSDHAINAAVDLHVVDEFISEGHLNATVPAFREAAAKTLRHVENKAGFTIDEMAEPIVLGGIQKLKNFFTGGRVVNKLKGRPEYSQMLALSALLEDLGSLQEPAPVTYPTVTQFAERPTQTRRITDKPALRWAVAGASGLAGAALVNKFANTVDQPPAQVRSVESQVREALAETPDTTLENAPKIRIAPRAEETAAQQRARRAPAEQAVTATAPVTQNGFSETAAVSPTPEPALKKIVEVKEPKAKRAVKAEKTKKVARKSTRPVQKPVATTATSPTANEILQETLRQVSPRRKSSNPKISQN